MQPPSPVADINARAVDLLAIDRSGTGSLECLMRLSIRIRCCTCAGAVAFEIDGKVLTLKAPFSDPLGKKFFLE